MSIQVKRRREAASFLATYVGAQGELLVDTTGNRVQVHDGATPGGFPAAKLSEVAGLAPVQSVAGRTGAVTLGVGDVAGGAPLASPVLTGTPTAPTAATGTSTAQLATTAFVAAGFVSYSYAAASYATAANATLTGTPTAPTQGAGDNSARLATTAYADRAAGANFARTQVNDAAYTVLASDRTVAVIALTAGRTLALPKASSFPGGATLTIVDESGACSSTNAITLLPNGTDTISGASSATLATPYAFLALTTNTANKWTIVDFVGATTAQLTNRNAVVNGNFAVNQRAYAGNVALAAGAYAHDRWKAGAGGGTYTFSQGVPDTQVTITAGSLVQAVDAPNVYAAAYWLTWSGTAPARVYQGAASASPAYAAGTPTTIGGTTVNAILVSGLTPGVIASLEFGAGTLGLVQFEAALPNAGPTRFERRQLGQELALCMRYYRSIGGSAYYKFGFCFANSATSLPAGLLGFYVPMRATPTVTTTGSFGIAGGGSYLTVSSIAYDQGDAYSVSVTVTVSGGASGFYLLQANADATARINLSAEI